VALIAPAGPVVDVAVETGLRRCRALGFEPRPGTAIRARYGYLAGTDDERAADLQAAIEGDCAAIWALRGGYGTLRTLRHVDLAPLLSRPKAFIGFSDNTVVHLALHQLGVTSYHGPHAGFRHFPATTEQAFRSVLMADGPAGRLPLPEDSAPRALVAGSAEGLLIGGNLALLAAVCGTPYQPDTRGAILFLEEVEEPQYRIDRMLMQLRLAGLLDGVAGIALGAFTPPEDERPDQTRDLDDVIGELLEPLGVPVVLGLPIGHERENWTVPLGVRARLHDQPPGLEILEPSTGER
jgi:muramoyltetrapeptide carboxypeptidase